MIVWKVLVALMPAASLTVTLPLGKSAAVVGVPVKPIELPVTTAVSPVGKPLWLVIV